MPPAGYPYPPVAAPTRKGPPPWVFIVIGIAVVLLVLCGVLGYVLANGNSSVAGSPTATATPFTIAQTVPGLCANDTKWSTASSTVKGNTSQGYNCSSSGLTLYSNDTSKYLAEAFFTNPMSDKNFSVSVQVSGLNASCAGLGFTQNLKGYIGYACDDGSWFVNQYDANGNVVSPKPGSGNGTSGSSVKLTMVFTASQLQFLINNLSVVTVARDTTIRPNTLNLALEVDSGTSSGQFSNFVYQVIPS